MTCREIKKNEGIKILYQKEMKKVLFVCIENSNRSNDNVEILNFDGTLSYTMLGGIWQIQGGWSATTKKEDFNGDGNMVNTGAWYTGIVYALNLGGRNTNFNITYGQSYNAAMVPMPISNASPTFG